MITDGSQSPNVDPDPSNAQLNRPSIDYATALAMQGSVMVPERTRHLAFGAVAAGWATLTRLRVIEIVDEVVGPRRVDAGASIGTYLAPRIPQFVVKRSFESGQ